MGLYLDTAAIARKVAEETPLLVVNARIKLMICEFSSCRNLSGRGN